MNAGWRQAAQQNGGYCYMELPAQFLEHMKQLLPREEYQAWLDSYKEERVYGLRVNTAKLSPEEFEAICPFPIQRIPWIPNGYYYDGNSKPAKDPYYYAGLYYLQEPSAMTPACLLPIEPGECVLDLCAAPGGKSTELAAKLKGRGILVSNDISNSRAKALLKNLELFGTPNALITCEAPYRLAEAFPEYFDKILIDAPCSGEGMFRKDSSVIKSWLEHGNEFYVKLQKEITSCALKMLKPGGILLYSTCTFSPMEDEQMVQFMLDTDKSLSIVQPSVWYEGFDHGHPEWANGNPALANCVRIWPHRMKGEGHFLALLKKSGEPAVPFSGRQAGKCQSLPQSLAEFMTMLSPGTLDFSKLQLRQEKAALALEEIENQQKGLRILRNGLLLGECKKNRFEPSQALAMALKKGEFSNCINLCHDDARVVKYLKGETIEADSPSKGWQLICVDGFPLGFGKASGTTIKNKYLAGWRWM